MDTRCLLTGIIFAGLLAGNAQAFGLRIGGGSLDELRAIAIGADGDTYLAGFTRSFGSGAGDAWVVRIGADAQVRWQTRLGTGGIDLAEAVSAVPDGGAYVAGHHGGTAPGSRNAWIARLASDGRILWQRSLGGSSGDRFLALATASDGVAAAGETASVSRGQEDAWMVRFDSNGAILWQRSLGGTGIDTFRSLSPTPDGGWAAGGSTTSFGATSLDPWIVRFDGNGSVLWQRRWSGPDSEKIRSIHTLGDGGFVIAGRAESPARIDGWIARLNRAGAGIWQRRVVLADITNVHPSADGGLLAAGALQDGSGRSTIIKFSPGGARVWQQGFAGTTSALPQVQSTSTGSYLFATASAFSGNQDAVLVQLNARGVPDGACTSLTTALRSTIATLRFPAVHTDAAAQNSGPGVLRTTISRRPAPGRTMNLCSGGNEQSRSGAFTGNPGTDYRVSGSAQLVQTADGGVELRLGNDFSSSSGPRLEVYLSTSSSVTGGSLTLGALKSTSGTQTYAVPAGVNLDTFSWVIIHCVSFNVSFGYAQLR